jgi:tripartite-type tricarboxylate transporter receptor subunit TctC
MKLPRRCLLQLAVGAAVLPATTRRARTLDYPTRPVYLKEGFGAGSAPDVIARLIGQALSERLGQSFVIENRTGWASNIAAEQVARATPEDTRCCC